MMISNPKKQIKEEIEPLLEEKKKGKLLTIRSERLVIQ